MATDGTLYTFRRCPYAIRARLALALVADLELEVREVVLARKPQAMLELSPKGTVPVLQLSDGGVLEESLDIMHWAVARPLRQTLGALDAEGQALIASNDGPFKHHLDRYKYPTRYEGVDGDAAFDAAVAAQQPLAQRLERTSAKLPYLDGEQMNFADLALFPFVRQFAAVDPGRFAAALPRVEAWRAAWQQHPLFLQVMTKLEPWQPLQEVVTFAQAFPVGES